ncbi:inositol phospholipid synthesis and fat-storage-inducing TM-domain-containing protein [Xylaria sp. FL1042]|nr:inositol phospholipid synthesis and fat-storage-inducing TM-domain-containing protein [Xylaria sp. FL1042]
MAEGNHPLRSRGAQMTDSSVNGDAASSSAAAPKIPAAMTTAGATMATATMRNSPFLPTPLETLLLAVYPSILVLGTLFSVLSPETRGAPYDAARQSHVQAHAPSYFARKDNLFNVLFVKRGWLWVTAAFLAFVATHPTFRRSGSGSGSGRMAVRAAARWALVTAWWVFVTQWCFGPPLIDRGFRFTGGKCEVAHDAVAEGTADHKDLFTAAACRTAGGNWSGGHDISGHVFLLVLGSCFLAQEVVWVVVRAGAKIVGSSGDDRAIVMGDGAFKGARVEAEHRAEPHERHLGVGGKFALGVVGLSLWMLLMTAAYFHTWFEKLTGLLVASTAVYTVYILPRWIPALRGLVGLPGI